MLITLTACGAAIATAVGLAVTSQSSAPGAGRYQHTRLDVGGDIYHYAVYVPSGYRSTSAVPLVVVLHGCSTGADQQAAASRYDPIAEQHRFVVLYPDVDPVDEANGRCWKGIWDPGTEGRGRGDAAAIADMTHAVLMRWHIDPSRVYAIGISAGAFETSILGASYPDVYAAIGIHSGAAYMGGQLACAAGPRSSAHTDALARAALAVMGTRARVMPVIIFHGDQDNTVPYWCGQQALAQWLGTNNLVLRHEGRAALPSTPTISHAAVPAGHAYTVATYTDSRGCPVAQLWTVHGMGHYWSGGSADPASARYTDPRGPSAATDSWAFFSHWRLSGPVGPCTRHGP
ncbi:MAG: PHB depolymerase family esterase [Actinomycetota bacterium]|nr:PHB depolymerase family esterase [Actinomycetota bacterium]